MPPVRPAPAIRESSGHHGRHTSVAPGRD